MVIARIFGGLGNQMFIYAAASSLAARNGVPLVLDVRSGFPRDPYKRSYQLHRFNIQAQEASRWDSFESPGGSYRRGVLRALRSVPLIGPSYIRETDGFEPELLESPISCKTYLEGYWQDERYFQAFAPKLRQDFTLSAPPTPESQEIARRMAGCEAVSLHARRYDSVADPRLALAAPSLTIDFYTKAIQTLAGKVAHPHFFCFSDQPEWFRQNLKTDYPMTFVTHNQQTGNDHEDMWLMSQCRHHIIANSTFSWWGAWLGSNPAKMILAPSSPLRPPAGGRLVETSEAHR